MEIGNKRQSRKSGQGSNSHQPGRPGEDVNFTLNVKAYQQRFLSKRETLTNVFTKVTLLGGTMKIIRGFYSYLLI